MKRPPPSLGARASLAALAILLRLYPRDFRERMGGELLDGAEERYRAAAARGRPALLRFVVRTTWGMLRNAPGTWLDDRTSAGRHRSASPREAAAFGDGLGRDLAHATRRLRRSPWLSTYSVVGLALGLGVFGALFTVVDGILWEPLPWEEPDELAWVWRVYPSLDLDRGYLGGPEVLELGERHDLLDGLALFRSGEMGLGGGDGSPATRVDAVLASPNVLDVLGIAPALGRGLRPEDALEEAPQVVLLSHALWSSDFGGDPTVVGRMVLVEGTRAEVVGVLPQAAEVQHHQFTGPPTTAEILLPLSVDLASQSPFRGFLGGLIRRQDGVSDTRLTQELDALASTLDATVFEKAGVGLRFTKMHDDLVRDVRPVLLAVLAGSLFLLAAMTASLVAVILGQSSERSGEFELRRALGASPLRAGRGLGLESLVLVSVGTLGALLVGRGFLGLMHVAPSDLPRTAALQLSTPAIVAAGGLVALVSLIAVGFSALRRDSGQVARGGHRVLGGDRGRRALVGLQLAVSVVLLAGVGLLGRSVHDLLAVESGFEPDGAVTFELPFPEDRWPDAAARRPLQRRLLAEFAAIPGVTGVGAGTDLPLDGASSFQTVVRFPDAPGNSGDEDADAPLMDYLAVSPGYLDAVGARLLEGRAPTWADDAASPGVALITRETAHRFFPGESAVGRTLEGDGETLEIIGVVEQLHLYDIAEPGWGQVIRPLGQTTRFGGMFVVRADREPDAIIPAIRSVVSAADPEIPVERIRPLQGHVDDSLAERRLVFQLLLGFGIAAVFVAALGIYGVASLQVTRRRGEVGVRLALGAGRAGVVGLLLRDGLGFALVGVAAGVVVSAFAGRALGSLLYGVTPADPLTLAGVAALVLGTAAAASLLPARRAASADPAEVLRGE